MFNLLPLEQKKRIRREYLTRVSIIACLFGLGAIVISVVFLVPLYILSRSIEAEAATAKKELLATLLLKEADSIRKNLSELKSKLKILDKVADDRRPSQVIERLVLEKPAHVTLENISYRRVGEKVAELVVRGKAKDRETLTLFLKNVKESKEFEKADVPVSDFAGNAEIDFTLTAKGDF